MTPNPTQGPDFVTYETCDTTSKPWCKHRATTCLRIAADRDWRSLSCAACDAYAPLTGEAAASEVATLRRFGELIAPEVLRPLPRRVRRRKRVEAVEEKDAA